MDFDTFIYHKTISNFTSMENLQAQSLRCGRSSFPARFSSPNRSSRLRWLQPQVELSIFCVTYLRSRRRPPPIDLQNSLLSHGTDGRFAFASGPGRQ